MPYLKIRVLLAKNGRDVLTYLFSRQFLQFKRLRCFRKGDALSHAMRGPPLICGLSEVGGFGEIFRSFTKLLTVVCNTVVFLSSANSLDKSRTH